MKLVLLALIISSLAGCAKTTEVLNTTAVVEEITESTEEITESTEEIENCNITLNDKNLNMEMVVLKDIKNIFGKPVDVQFEVGYYNKFKLTDNGNELVVPTITKDENSKVDYFTLKYSEESDKCENSIILNEIKPDDNLESIIKKLGEPKEVDESTEFPFYLWEIGNYNLDVTFKADKPWMIGFNKRLEQ